MRLKGTEYHPGGTPGGGAPQWELAHRELDVTNRDDRSYLDATIAMGQNDAAAWWDWYERIGEVRYAINRAARVAGYMRPGAAYQGAGGVTTKTHQDSPTVLGIVNSISSRFGGVRGLVQRYYVLMKVPGEGVFIKFRPAPGAMADGYWFMSPDEVVRSGVGADVVSLSQPITWRTARGAKSWEGGSDPFKQVVAPEDIIGRVWTPSYRFVDECDSPMAAVAPLCDMLDKLTESIKDRIMSRFASNGLFLVPSGINDAAIGGDQPQELMYSKNKVLNALIHMMSVNLVRTGHAVGRMPGVLMGPADELEKVRHLIFDAKIDEVDLKLRIELIGRILEGLDQQKSATKDGADQSHWGAWATEEAERRITVEPDLQQLDHLLTRMVLWRELKALEWPDARILPWTITHELDAASTRVNQAEDFRQAFDRGELSGDALRRATGATPVDKPDENTRLMQLGHKIGNPILAHYGIEAITVEKIREQASAWGKPAPGPQGQAGGDPAPVAPGSNDPGSPNSRDSNTPKGQEPNP